MSAISKIKNTVVLYVQLILMTASVLLIAACDSKTETVVSGIPDAENLFFTPDGRLFVSGGENVFEIFKNQHGRYDKLDAFHESCLVEGLAQSGEYIYGVCSRTRIPELLDSYLIASKIEPFGAHQIDPDLPGLHPTMNLEIISPLSEITIPNGVAVDAAGDLYIADYGAPRVFKVTFNGPLEVNSISTWKRAPGMLFNGLKWKDDDLYFTAQHRLTTGVLGRIKQYSDGTPGDVEVLFERKQAVLDDLLPYDGGFLIADYLKGSVLFWQSGSLQSETEGQTFFAPTAIAQTQGPLFEPDAFLVTEKGVIGDFNSSYGNKLGIFYPQF
ncbi:hypothetical protein FT643_12875 [Ketobacter sp. MCCC 1A13808]|uniref:hypothetical protein n=1 Tax=Ketobacter sp. MCCC 1A13808 TaxID=2602738 RepID=UPI0012EBC6E0|nr:hypothetical protein [Ketobacter sp. MCCC 1A13808]MVF13030.1 hypothetical protein [Ketobacter sp. MCCC 1A13808]